MGSVLPFGMGLMYRFNIEIDNELWFYIDKLQLDRKRFRIKVYLFWFLLVGSFVVLSNLAWQIVMYFESD